MTISRYEPEEVFLNDNTRYRKVFERRGIKRVYHYGTPSIKTLDPSDYTKIKTIPHIWTLGDRYYKLAYKYYQDPTLWWVLGWFNQKPTDAHVSIGDPIYIPIPLDDILYHYNTR